MKWIRHDTDANQDARLQNVLLDYGLEGYGLYWYCIELVAGKIDIDNLTFELEHDARILARNTGSTPQKVEEMMRYFVKLGLFEDSAGVITCLKIARRLNKSMTSNPQMRDLIDKIKSHDGVMIESRSIMQDKTRSDKTRLNKKDTDLLSENSDASQIESAFEIFWAAGMRKVNKKGALKSFKAICKKDGDTSPECIAKHLAQDVRARLSAKQFGFETLHPMTYINGERWNDEITARPKATGNGFETESPAERIAAAFERQRASADNQQSAQAAMAMDDWGRALPNEVD